MEFFALFHHLVQQFYHQPRRIVGVGVGVFLVADHNVGQLKHPRGDVAVQIKHHTDGHIAAEFFAQRTQKIALKVGIAVSHSRTVNVQGNCVNGRTQMLLPHLLNEQIAVVLVSVLSGRRAGGDGDLAGGFEGDAQLTALINKTAHHTPDPRAASNVIVTHAHYTHNVRKIRTDIAERIGLVLKSARDYLHTNPSEINCCRE